MSSHFESIIASTVEFCKGKAEHKTVIQEGLPPVTGFLYLHLWRFVLYYWQIMGGVAMKISYTKEMEVRYTVDVLVIGGGPAGVAAAVSAARQGAKTMILEQTGSFGGAGTVAMVPEIMNFDDGEKFLAGGFGREIHDQLFPPCAYTREWRIADTEKLKRLYDSLLQKAGVQFLLYSRVIDAVVKGKNVTHAIISGPEGCFAVAAKQFIDCSGSAHFCMLSGCQTLYGDSNGVTMPATLCSLWGNVDFEKFEVGQQGKHLEEAYEKGVLSQYDTVLPGMKPLHPACKIAGGNIGHAFGVDDRSAEAMSSAMVTSRKVLAEYETYYRTYVHGCEDAKLVRTADTLGIRESRRAVCDFMLTQEYFYGAEPFADEIGRYSYPIDIHPMTADASGMAGFTKSLTMRHEKGQSYSIPYRCLVLRDMDNLLTAGRTVGTDRSMQASVRVIPGAYITGQAAGVAAALCVETGVSTHDVSIRELQRRLREIGAYLEVKTD